MSLTDKQLAAAQRRSLRAPCPCCGKTVKLRKQGIDRWPSTIPHHHAARTQGVSHG